MLYSLYGGGELFTWVNRRSPPDIIFERMNRYVGTFNWRIMYPVVRAQSLELFHSDHRPILLELGAVESPHRTSGVQFCFEPNWIIEADCVDIVIQGWCKHDESLSLVNLISLCKIALKQWADERFRNLPRQITRKQEQLNHLKTVGCWKDSMEKIHTLEKNSIRGLMSVHGDWCSEKNGMADIIMDYFSSLLHLLIPRMQRNIL